MFEYGKVKLDAMIQQLLFVVFLFFFFIIIVVALIVFAVGAVIVQIETLNYGMKNSIYL